MRWEGGGWVAEGVVAGIDVHYVARLGPDFRTRQFLLFRDLDEPDLWLATDGRGNWGEVNGAVREDLAGAWDIAVGCTPFTHSIPVRALGLPEGGTAEVELASIDVDTLAVGLVRHRYTRLARYRWRVESAGSIVDLDVDEHGLVLVLPGRFRRVLPG